MDRRFLACLFLLLALAARVVRADSRATVAALAELAADRSATSTRRQRTTQIGWNASCKIQTAGKLTDLPSTIPAYSPGRGTVPCDEGALG